MRDMYRDAIGLSSAPIHNTEILVIGMDTIMLAIIYSGFALSAAHFRSVYTYWRTATESERRRQTVVRELHADQSLVTRRRSSWIFHSPDIKQSTMRVDAYL